MTKAIDEGRAALGEWVATQPANFFESDRLLQALIARDGLMPGDGGDREEVERLREYGAVAAGPLDQAVQENNLTPNLPRRETWEGVGRTTGGFGHHPSYHVAGKHIYESGIM